MTTQTKVFIIGGLLGLGASWALYIAYFRPDTSLPAQPEITDEHIEDAINAYGMALDNQEPQSVLDDLNTKFAEDFGLRVYQRNADLKIVVTDLKGKEVKVV